MSSFFDEVWRAETKLFSIRACRILQRLLASGSVEKISQKSKSPAREEVRRALDTD
jgi:hypothetical protein